MASPFAEFADFLAKLRGDLHDLLANVGLAGFSQLIFIVALNHYCRENSDQHENNQPDRQTDLRGLRHCKSALDGQRFV